MALAHVDPTGAEAEFSDVAAGARVWVLRGNRLGDNRMIETLAAASGLPWRALPLRYNAFGALKNLRPRGSLYSLSGPSRALIAPPYPDVVITSGKRAVPVALRVKALSGGRTRLVHVGRPRAPLDWFDLVLTTPHYGLPPRANVVVGRLPFVSPPAPSAIRPDLAALPRPRIVVVAGGHAPPLVFDASTAAALAAQAIALAKADGGSVLATTSPRTTFAAAEALRLALQEADVPTRVSLYGEGPNEYRAFLAAADRFLVTDDTASMVTEAALTGAPVSLFRLPRRPGLMLRAVNALRAACARRWRSRRALDWLMAQGLAPSDWDIDAFTRGLEADGLLDGGPLARSLAEAELAAGGARLRALADDN